MTTNHHSAISTGAAANAGTINTPLGQLDAVLTEAYSEVIGGIASYGHLNTRFLATEAYAGEVVAARGGFGNLDARLDALIAAGGQVVGTLASGTSTTTVAVGAGEGTPFTVGAHVAYTISGTIRYNTVAAKAANSITLGTSPGGTIASGSLIFQITDSEYASAFAVNAAASGVNRTLPNAMDWINADQFNVRAYGATGAGVVDDAPAIQAAINAAEANGSGTVIVPEGTYVVVTPLTIDSPYVNLVGVGRPTIVASAAFDAETYDPEPGVVFIYNTHHVTVRDIQIEAGNATSSNGFMIRDSEHCLVSRVKITGAARVTTQTGAGLGIYGDSHFNRVEYCDVYDVEYSGINVAQDDTPVSDQPTGNVLFGNHVQNVAEDGFDIYRTKGTMMIGNFVSGVGRMGVNLAHDGNATYPNDEVLIMGNYIRDGLKHGIHLEQQGVRCRIIGNYCKSNAWNGINVPGSGNNDCIISDNVCYGNQQHGILAGENFATITGNKCKENGASSSYHGIHIHDEGDGTNCVGNTCTGNGGAGINVLNCDSITVNSNYCFGNILDGIHCDNCLDMQINDNRVYANVNHGIFLTGITRFQIHNNYCHGNGTGTNATFDNIRIQSTSINGSVQGNVCYRGDGGNKARYGIRIEDSSCTNVVVTNNYLWLAGVTGDFATVATDTITTPGNRRNETYTWAPTLTGSGGAPTITYTQQAGRFWPLGNIVFYHADIQPATLTGGSGGVRITLPKTALSGAGTYVIGQGYTHNVDLPGTPVALLAQVVGGQAYLDLYVAQDNGAVTAVPLNQVSVGDIISVSGWYFVQG